jgi:hypothetical protein
MKQRNYLYGVVLLMTILITPPLINKGMAMDASDAPESVTIDALSEYYEAVEFDHSMHVEATEQNCAKCHHHLISEPVKDSKPCAKCHKYTEDAESLSCAECHIVEPFSAEGLAKSREKQIFHRMKPGLKGAYHNLCLDCHKEAGAATDCVTCHARTENGEKFYKSGKFAPKVKAGGSGGH